MNTLVKISPAAVLASLLLLAPPPSALAQKYWNANDGDWNDGSAWSPTGVPTGQVAFANKDQSTNSTVNLSVSGTHTINQLFVNSGKTVILNFEDGASLSTTSGLWQLNTKYGNDALLPAASHLAFHGPTTGTATVKIHSLQFGGASSVDTSGSSITFDGPGLIVTNATGGSATVVGRSSNDNLLSIRNEADVTLHGLWISQSTVSGQGYKDNRTVVDNASLTINGGAGNTGLFIGSLRTDPGSSDYDNGLQSNSLIITNNGTVTMTTGNGGSSAGQIRVGFATNAHSNLLSIDNGGELLIKSSNSITAGDATATNRGGNAVRVGSGGTLRTNGLITINGHNTTGQNDGRNRLHIESGGTLYSSNTINIHGLLRLEEGGSMEGRTLTGADAALKVNIEEGGLFEAEGEGLGKNVETTINGGTLAVGIEGHTTAASLTLRSTITFTGETGSLSLSLFGNGTADTINLTSTGHIIFSNTSLVLTLQNYSPQSGDSWTLFTGSTGNVSGLFDLSLLPELSGGLEWDTSSFNSAGEWRIAVIPEPGTVGMTLFGLSCFLLFGAMKRRSLTTSA